MRTYLRNCLLFISFLFPAACRPAYPLLHTGNFDRRCFQKFVPDFRTQWYKASVDVGKKHFGGLLLIKKDSGSSIRTVFTNEGGATFFDFEFGPGSPKVNFTMRSLNKAPVIRTLQNDLELILMRYEGDPQAQLLSDEKSNYLKVSKDKKTIYLVATKDCRQLDRIEEVWGGKKKVEVILKGYSQQVPDSVSVIHHNFNMQIYLKKFEQ